MIFGPLLDHVPAWLMVLFRLSGIFIMAPVLGATTIPRQIKVYLTLGLSLCIYPMLLDSGRPSAGFIGYVIDHGLPLWSLIASVGLELLIGYAIGFAASLPIMGMQMGGHIIDQQIGLGIAGVLNPELGEQSGIVGQLLFMLALAVFVILGGHRIMLSILIGSFDQIPLGGFAGFDSLVGLMLGLMTVMFQLALRVAAPLLCLIFLETVAMGFIARTVPAMNVLSVGFALRIVIGFALLVGCVGIAASVYTDTTARVLRELTRFFAT